jgi:glycosyltransferase involved in cell wall biosynthesis
MAGPARSDRKLRILHVLRAPLGGLFRHVVDLARGLAERGHAVGLVTDSLTGGERATQVLAELAPILELGVTRAPMHRNPHFTDVGALRHVIRRIADTNPDVVHGHGSKGGFFARAPGLLPGSGSVARAYTPHGGSFNYKPGSLVNGVYMMAEATLARATDIFLFESAYIGRRFDESVGYDKTLKRIVLNGIAESETIPVIAGAEAADFVYVGELRSAKGIDTMIDALRIVRDRIGRVPRAILVGSGPDEEALHEHARRAGLEDCISMPGPMPARQAFSLGKILVVPSRAESLPYVVIEAAGAHIPMIATSVGGIPEIFGPYADRLIPCDDAERLAREMIDALASGDDERRRRAGEIADFVAERFTIANMVESVIAGYRDALAARDPLVRSTMHDFSVTKAIGE